MTNKKEFSVGLTLAAFIKQLEVDIQQQLDAVVEAKSAEWDLTIKGLRDQIAENTARLAVTVDKTTHVVEGLRHYQLPKLIQITAQRLPVLLVGMSGTGKSHGAEQVAEALGLPFYAISVGAQTSKSDLLGYMHAGGDYVPTLFREAFENGGVFLMDEMDAGNANVLIQVNAALSNNYCAFPNGMVKRHDDFVFVASANTYGQGANRQYVGRNQLDASTLDRFVILNWEVDQNLERVLAGDALQWYGVVCVLREAVEKEEMRVLITPRATLYGSRLLAAGMSLADVCTEVVLSKIPKDKVAWASKLMEDEIGHTVFAK